MLRLPHFRMVEPTTWTEAAKLLREHGAAGSDIASGTSNVPVMLIAGGTDLFPNMKRRQFTPQVLISLGRVKGAREISNGSGLHIAAGATLTEEPYDRPWGIYSGYFRDPDGHLWEVIWNPRATVA